MLKLTLAQMRQSLGRLTAAGLAVMLGAGFISAAFAASSTVQHTFVNFALAEYGAADIVLSTEKYNHVAAETLNEIPGIKDSIDNRSFLAAIEKVSSSGTGSVPNEANAINYFMFSQATTNEKLQSQKITSGRVPSAKGEVALLESVADNLDLTIGSKISIFYNQVADPVTAASTSRISEEFEIVGIVSNPAGIFGGIATNLLDHDDFLQIFENISADFREEEYPKTLIELSADAELSEVKNAITEKLAGSGHYEIQTRDEIVDQSLRNFTGQDNFLLVVLLTFASISLVVAALVVSNTFQVLVSHRARTLALLRAVGASKQQLRRSILFESFIVGAVASAIGLLVGTIGTSLIAKVVQFYTPNVTVADGIYFSSLSVCVTLIAGIAITLIAAIQPARAATKYSPIVALLPYESIQQKSLKRTRVIWSLSLLAIGVLFIVFGIILSNDAASSSSIIGIAVLLGVFGGFLAVIGLLLSTVFFTPTVIKGIGKIFPKKVAPKIAVANAVRNPFRTASTVNALIIGAGLVAMMATGGLSAKATLNNEVSNLFSSADFVLMPIPSNFDGSVTETEEPVTYNANFTSGQKQLFKENEGIAATTDFYSSVINVNQNNQGNHFELTLLAADNMSAVYPEYSVLDGLKDDTLYVQSEYLVQTGLVNGSELQFSFYNNTELNTLRIEVSEDLKQLGTWISAVSVDTAAKLGLENFSAQLWGKLKDGANANEIAEQLTKSFQQNTQIDPSAPEIWISGSSFMKSSINQVIDAVLAVVMVLLAMTVLISLIGVANTLSLSVLERRRESATLRAMGLSKRQLRAMLAIEGVSISFAGAIIGTVFGLIMGWAGVAIIFASLPGDALLVVPWVELGVIFLIALIAGVLASVLPARSSVKDDIVTALSPS